MASIFVGIPTHNRPRFVRDAVLSVLKQTSRDVRVLVSDNASDPSVSQAVATFVRGLEDSRVSYHLHPTDTKEYGQGRFLFSQCTSDYFVILHDDDRLEPLYLETALARMQEHPQAACFVANPYIFDARGSVLRRLTTKYHAEHGRNRYAEGLIDVLEPLLHSGFIPISGTLFRTSSLRESGFVDEDCQGNYPFEFNLLLRLGEMGAKAYYAPQELLGFRVHGGSLHHTLRIKYNEQVLATMLKILERRRFRGRCERLRRKIVAYNYRHYAMVRITQRQTAQALLYLCHSVKLNPFSYRNWTYLTGAFLCPFLLRPLLQTQVVPISPR